MKKIAFVSDFDGTLTHKDFYHIVIEKYLKDWGKSFYEDWKKMHKINVEFLNKIFGSMNLSEDELKEEILKIPLDEHAKEFIERINNNDGSFFILSAGTSYYIDVVLADRKIKDIQVISMHGEYRNRGIEIIPDKADVYFSEVFGIDKKKVVENLKKEYERVFFAGDSEPDLEAAKAAHIAFAKNDLKELLTKENKEFVPFDNFKQIQNYLIGNGWLK